MIPVGDGGIGKAHMPPCIRPLTTSCGTTKTFVLTIVNDYSMIPLSNRFFPRIEGPPMRIGYSYLRYSSAEQGDGDSIRRQTKARTDWCKRHPDVQLDTTRTYLDRGRSAYRGRHLQKGGALAAFLSEVEKGDIPRGSVLIIEN